MKQNIDRKSSHFITIPYLKLGKYGIMIGVLAVLDTILFTWVLLKEWRVCWFIIIGKLFLQFIFTALFRELNHDIFSFLWDTYDHILWYFCLWQSHVILQIKAYICFYKKWFQMTLLFSQGVQKSKGTRLPKILTAIYRIFTIYCWYPAWANSLTLT